MIVWFVVGAEGVTLQWPSGSDLCPYSLSSMIHSFSSMSSASYLVINIIVVW